MTTQELLTAYYYRYGKNSICNNHEVQAIADYALDVSHGVRLMYGRMGQPSPRVPMKFTNLPISGASQEARDTRQRMPLIPDIPAMRAWIAFKYKLATLTDGWLIETYLGKYQRRELPLRQTVDNSGQAT